MKRRKFDCVLHNPSRSILHMRIQLNSEMSEVQDSVQYTLYKVPFNFTIQRLDFSNAFIVIAAKTNDTKNNNIEKVFVYKMEFKREQNFPYFAADRAHIGLSSDSIDRDNVQFIMIGDDQLLVVNNSANKNFLYSVFEIKGIFMEISCITKVCLEKTKMKYINSIQNNHMSEEYLLSELINHLPEIKKLDDKNFADLLMFAVTILPLVSVLLKAVLIEVRRKSKQIETYPSRESFFKDDRVSWREDESILTKSNSETIEFFDR